MKKTILLFAAASFLSASLPAQQTFLAPVFIKTDPNDAASSLTVYGTNDEDLNEFPFVRLTGVGSISGEVDSSLSKAARAQFEFYPSPSLSFYASYNRGVKADTLGAEQNVSPNALVFPDASKVGFNFGACVHWYPGSRNLIWTRDSALVFFNNNAPAGCLQRPTGNRSHQFRVTAYYQYSYQFRSYFRQDSISPQSYKFNSGTHSAGAKATYAVQIGKNVIGLMGELYYSRLNISRSSVYSFRQLYDYVPRDPGKSLPGFYNGVGLQTTVFFNKIGFVFNFMSYRAAADKEFVFDGLTQGQYYIGLTIASDFLTF